MPQPVGRVGELLSRLRWSQDEDEDATELGDVGEDRALMARTYVYLFGLGATVALLTLLLKGDFDRWPPGVILAAAMAYAIAAVCLVGYDRLPMWAFKLMPPLGTVAATIVVFSGGTAVAAAYVVLYFWVVFAAFSFLSRRAGLFNVAFALAGYSLALQWVGGAFFGTRLLMAISALTVAGLLIGALRARTRSLLRALGKRGDQQEAIARIGRRAVQITERAELFEWVASLVAETLGVERAAVFELPDGQSLMFRRGHGFAPELVRGATVPLDDSFLGPALISDEPVVYESTVEPLVSLGPISKRGRLRPTSYAGIAAAIRGGEETLGVLAVYGSPRLKLSEADTRFVQTAANVLAEASRRHAVEEEARRQAFYDPVTDRPNRILFMDRLGEALLRADRAGLTLGAMIIEIDDFKLINDGYGDLFGNALLRAFAVRLRQPLYLADTVARLGGPEFAVLCEDLDAERGAVEIAEGLVEAIAEPFDIAGERVRLSASIGVALSDPGAAPKEIIARADAALHKARDTDAGSYVIFDEDLLIRLRERLTLGQALAQAPERDELSLALQPIVSLEDHEVVATECLLRWERPEHGLIAPLDFLPDAERSGAILPLGEWVVGESVRVAARMRDQLGDRAPLPLHVNISPRQLAHAEFVDGLTSALERGGVQPSDLVLEITEDALLRDSDIAQATVEAVRELGVGTVLDDFGTGLSSLGHLKRFKFDAVKIDRSFVSGVADDLGDAAIVAAVLRTGQALGLEMIAEGIETAKQEEQLLKLGCRLGQGRLYAAPLDFDGSLSPPRDRTASSAS